MPYYNHGGTSTYSYITICIVIGFVMVLYVFVVVLYHALWLIIDNVVLCGNKPPLIWAVLLCFLGGG